MGAPRKKHALWHSIIWDYDDAGMPSISPKTYELQEAPAQDPTVQDPEVEEDDTDPEMPPEAKHLAGPPETKAVAGPGMTT